MSTILECHVDNLIPTFPLKRCEMTHINSHIHIENLSEGGFEPPPTFVDQNTPVKEEFHS